MRWRYPAEAPHNPQDWPSSIAGAASCSNIVVMMRTRLAEAAAGAVPDIHAARRMAFPLELQRTIALS